jgi:hypothetical protein
MSRFRTTRPSAALVISVIALMVALGGTSYAAFGVPKNSVGTKQLKNGAVTTKKIANGAVTGAKVKLSTLGTVPSATAASRATTAATASNALALGGARSSAFLRGTITVVRSNTVATATFGTAQADCPAGYQATGGGVAPENVISMQVTESSPVINGTDIDLVAAGQHVAATGWYGAVLNNSGTTKHITVAAVCSPTH